jgi:phosphate/sulfate permease
MPWNGIVDCGIKVPVAASLALPSANVFWHWHLYMRIFAFLLAMPMPSFVFVSFVSPYHLCIFVKSRKKGKGHSVCNVYVKWSKNKNLMNRLGLSIS